ncbi:pyridoxamine 5'-phosphate oxidase family protein [Actinoplanes sp. NPDC051859]|uniref:pyridoxamine 5'-phosphate oxidase family protein n=1 Tax=Actinoplanes sp. NPDC051859 TaxID=3363909 RepID=UPI0037BD7AAA
MATWSAFAAAEPHLSAAIRALLLQYGPGMGYLATVRPDGGPRVHPVSPVITDDGLYCFIVASPKRHDLERDGRYALHSYPPEENDDEAYVTGVASPVTNSTVIQHLADALHAAPRVDWRLFELSIETAMLRRHGPAGALPLAITQQHPPITLTWSDPTPPTGPTTHPSPTPTRHRTPHNAGPLRAAGVVFQDLSRATTNA